MLNINPREMLCAFPAGVVECQCPCYTASSLEKAGCLFTRHTAFDSPHHPPILQYVKKREREKRGGEKKRETSIFFTLADRSREQKRQFDLLMWEIRFPSEIYPMHSRIRV